MSLMLSDCNDKHNGRLFTNGRQRSIMTAHRKPSHNKQLEEQSQTDGPGDRRNEELQQNLSRLRAIIQRREERYQKFFEENVAGSFISKPDGRLVACNTAFARIFGFSSAEEAISRNVTLFYPSVEAREQLKKRLMTYRKLENYETELRDKNGKPVYVVENVIGEFNEKGELVEMRGYLVDNTKLARLEEQIRQMQKMESIGTLAGGMAHDFNNILGIILAHSSVLKERRTNHVRFEQSVEAIMNAAQRGVGVVRQLLTFARRTDVTTEVVDINRAIDDIIVILKETFPKTITFGVDLRRSIPAIVVDSNQLHQALLNLFVNARDAILGDSILESSGGTITVQTSSVDGTRVRERFADASAERYVCIRVADTGCGMDDAMLQRVFEPFFTTKKEGKGTGLGLSVVYGIVKTHQGFVDVESTVGKGSSFFLYFPIHNSK